MLDKYAQHPTNETYLTTAAEQAQAYVIYSTYIARDCTARGTPEQDDELGFLLYSLPLSTVPAIHINALCTRTAQDSTD